MEEVKFEDIDLSDPNNPKGLIKAHRKAYASEVTTSILTSMTIEELRKGSPLSDDEKNKIIEIAENHFEELIKMQLKHQYGADIKKHF